MRVKRNFDEIYATESDPWAIGAADSDRYNLYIDRILTASRRRDSALEIGCGFGALLARLGAHFDTLVGVDVSAAAVEVGRERFPFIEFRHGSLAAMEAVFP